MPEYPTKAGPGSPTGTTGGNGGNEPEYIDMSDAHTAGAVTGIGTRVDSVVTAWSQSGNAISAEITATYCDGIPEGYTFAFPAAVLLAELGVTNGEILNGEKTLHIKMRQLSTPGLSANFGCALARSSDESGNVSTLTGGGGGMRGNIVTASTVSAMSFDSTQETASTIYIDHNDCVAIASITNYGGYFRAMTCLREDSATKLNQAVDNTSGFALEAPIWVVFWAGSNASGGTSAPDLTVQFGVTDGPNFDAVTT